MLVMCTDVCMSIPGAQHRYVTHTAAICVFLAVQSDR